MQALSLVRGVAGSLLLRVVTALGTLLVSVTLAPLMGAREFGIYSHALSIVAILVVAATLGFPTLIIRETAKSHALAQWGQMKGLITFSTRVCIALSIALALLTIGIIRHFRANLEMGLENATILCVCGLPFLALGSIRSGILRGFNRVAQSQVPEAIVRPTIVIGGVLILKVLSNLPIEARHAIALDLFAGVAAFALGTVFVIRAIPTVLTKTDAVYEPALWKRSLVPLTILTAAQVANSQLDAVLLGFITQPRDVAFYRAAASLGGLIVFPLQAVNMVVGSHFSAIHATEDRASLQTLVTLSARLGFVPAIAGSAILALWGKPVLLILFGPEFGDAALPLIAISIGQAINAAMGPVDVLLNMTGNERSVAFGMMIGVVIHLILSLILIPYYGALGAALATAASIILWNLVLATIAHVRLGIDTTPFGRIRPRRSGSPE